MKLMTNVRAGGVLNYNQTIVRDTHKPRGVRVKTSVKAGGKKLNHNQTLVYDARKPMGLKVKTNVKAGGSGVKR